MHEELRIIVDGFNSRFDNLDNKVGSIDTKLDSVCNRCVHVPTFREQIKTLFTNIYAIWAVLCVLGTSLMSLLFWFFTATYRFGSR